MPHPCARQRPLVLITPSTHPVQLALAYATPYNVAGRAVYQQALCLLHADAERALQVAIRLAAAQGRRLKIFDAYRPQEAQTIFWNCAPDSPYVADPSEGSDHTRGTALDLTLVDTQGVELDMGTAFDDMTAASHHDSPAVSRAAQANRILLLNIMQGAGFAPYAYEWWHYALPRLPQYTLIDSALLGEWDLMKPVDLISANG